LLEQLSAASKMTIETYLRRRPHIRSRYVVLASIARIKSDIGAAGGIGSTNGRKLLREKLAAAAAAEMAAAAAAEMAVPPQNTLLGVLAYYMITSDYLWQEILEYV
jgi:hypothetical protein